MVTDVMTPEPIVTFMNSQAISQQQLLLMMSRQSVCLAFVLALQKSAALKYKLCQCLAEALLVHLHKLLAEESP